MFKNEKLSEEVKLNILITKLEGLGIFLIL